MRNFPRYVWLSAALVFLAAHGGAESVSTPTQEDLRQNATRMLSHLNTDVAVYQALVTIHPNACDCIFGIHEPLKETFLRAYREQFSKGNISDDEAKQVLRELKDMKAKANDSFRREVAKIDHMGRYSMMPGVKALDNGILYEVYESPYIEENGDATEADIFYARQPGRPRRHDDYNCREKDYAKEHPEMFEQIDAALAQMPNGAAWRLMVPTRLMGAYAEEKYAEKGVSVMEFTIHRSDLPKLSQDRACDHFAQNEIQPTPSPDGRPELFEQASYLKGALCAIFAQKELKGEVDVDTVIQQISDLWETSLESGAGEDLLDKLLKAAWTRSMLIEMRDSKEEETLSAGKEET